MSSDPNPSRYALLIRDASYPLRNVVGRFLSNRRRLSATYVSVLVVALIPQLLSPAQPDLAWILYAAERLLDGSRLYVDLVEINPPLIVWLNLPAAWLGEHLHVSDYVLYQLGVLSAALLCVALVKRQVGPQLSDDLPFRRIFLAGLLFAALLLPRLDFGEREHLAFCLVVPYAVLCSWRVQGRHPTFRMAAICGLLGGIGFAIKPFFVVPWAAAELYTSFRLRRISVRTETIIVGALGIAYIAILLLFTPGYIEIAAEYGRAYSRFMREPLLKTALIGNWAPLAWFGMVLYLVLRRLVRHRVLADIIAIMAVAFFVVAVAQGKGWRYHFYPSFAFTFLLLVVLAADRERPRSTVVSLASAAADLTLAGIVSLVVAGTLRQALQPDNPRYYADSSFPALTRTIKENAPGGSILVLSTYMSSAFPLARYAGVQSASRFNTLWPIAVAYQDAIMHPASIHYHTRQQMPPYERDTFDAVIDDFARRRPSMVLILRPMADRPSSGLRRISLPHYFGRDSTFTRLLEAYDLLGTTGHYLVYLRRDADTTR